jgi:hypothetical protein
MIEEIMRSEWSLSEIARLLGQPQHRLIYLCEKKAILPDLGHAHGRGSSRRFSARNVLEFALALHLRALDLPVHAVGAILYAFRSFEAHVRLRMPTHSLVESLRSRGAPELHVLIAAGPSVYFSLASQGHPPRLFGGIPLKPRRSAHRASVSELQEAQTGPAKIEVDVTEIAKALDLES